MSDAGQVKIYSLEETTWNVTPAAAMNTVAGATAISGGHNQANTRSSVLRSDYIRPDTIITATTGDKTIPFELQYGDVPISDWAEGVARSDWTAVKSVTGTDISFTSPNTVTSVTSDLSIYPVGSVVRIAGSTSNNIFDVVAARTATSITTVHGLITTEAAGDTVTIDNDGQLKTGTTLKSYTIEEYFQDLTTNTYLAQTGLRPTGMSLDFSAGIVTGSVGFAGSPPATAASSSVGTGAANAATTTKSFSGPQHVTAIFEGGAAVTFQVSQITLNLSAPTRFQHKLGQTNPWGIGANSFEPSGTINVYNSTDDAGLAFWDKFRSGTLTSLYWYVTRDGATYFFSLPSIMPTGGNPDVGNVDSDVMIPVAFNIDYSSTYSMLWAIDRFAA